MFPRAACKGKRVRAPSQQSPEHRQRRRNPTHISCRSRAGGDPRRARVGRPPRALRERQGPGNPRWGPPSGTCGNAGLLGGMSATEEPLSRSHAARHEATQPQHRGAEQGGARPRSPPPWHPPLPSAPGGSAGQGRRGEEPPARRGVAALRSERPRNAASLTERHQSLQFPLFTTIFRNPIPTPTSRTARKHELRLSAPRFPARLTGHRRTPPIGAALPGRCGRTSRLRQPSPRRRPSRLPPQGAALPPPAPLSAPRGAPGPARPAHTPRAHGAPRGHLPAGGGQGGGSAAPPLGGSGHLPASGSARPGMSAAALRGVAVGPHRDARAGGEPGLTARSPHSSARLGLRALPLRARSVSSYVFSAST